MKRILLSLVMVCAMSSLVAQSLTSYYMPDAIERRNLNVAFAPERGYFAIPVVGSTSVNLSGNLSVSSILYDQGDDIVTLLDGAVSASEALGNLKSGANFTSVSNRLEIFNFGAYCADKSTFWSFNIGLRTNVNVSMPYEFFEFVKLGKENNIEDINVYAESFIDLGFGYSKVVNEKLTVGARLKFLVGLASANANISKFNVKMDSDEWRVDADGELDIYGAGVSNEGSTPGSEFDFEEIGFGDSFSPAGFGVAIDLGAEYAVTDQLNVSLAANDIGFISWSQKSNASAVISATQSFAGVDVDGDGNSTTPDFSFEDITLDNAESKSTTRFLQANINAGAEYLFLDELISVGALYSAQIWRSKACHNLIGSASIRPNSWFTLAASYGFTNNNSNSLGLAVNLSPSWFNLFIATDILTSKKSAQYVPIEQSMMNVSLGLAVPIGGRSLRSKYTKY